MGGKLSFCLVGAEGGANCVEVKAPCSLYLQFARSHHSGRSAWYSKLSGLAPRAPQPVGIAIALDGLTASLVCLPLACASRPSGFSARVLLSITVGG